VNVFSVPNVRQATEMLSALEFEIVISEQKSEDGTFRDLLSLVQSKLINARFFFVMLPREAREQYTDAIRLGVTDAIPFPLDTPDIVRILSLTMSETRNEQPLQCDT
jgi:DNA-binding NtrC family response regulator